MDKTEDLLQVPLRPAEDFFVPRTRFIDGPGGEMNVSVNRQHRVYAEIELEHEFNPEVERNEERTRRESHRG